MSDAPHDAKPPADRPDSTLPAILVAAGVLAIAAILIFWPEDDAVESRSDAAEGASVDGGDRAGSPRGDGRVPARDFDEANAHARRREISGDATPQQLAPPTPAASAPREFASKAEEIAWYEDQLGKARTILDMRRRAVDRLPAARERIERGEDAAAKLADFELRKRVVESNLTEAEARLRDVEQRLLELRSL